MIGRWSFLLESPCCAAPVEHVTGSSEHAVNLRLAAVARCEACGREWLVAVSLELLEQARVDRRPTDEGGPVRCGTERGYHLHRRLGDDPCEECKAAHRRYEADRRARARQRRSPALFEVSTR